MLVNQLHFAFRDDGAAPTSGLATGRFATHSSYRPPRRSKLGPQASPSTGRCHTLEAACATRSLLHGDNRRAGEPQATGSGRSCHLDFIGAGRPLRAHAIPLRILVAHGQGSNLRPADAVTQHLTAPSSAAAGAGRTSSAPRPSSSSSSAALAQALRLPPPTLPKLNTHLNLHVTSPPGMHNFKLMAGQAHQFGKAIGSIAEAAWLPTEAATEEAYGLRFTIVNSQHYNIDDAAARRVARYLLAFYAGPAHVLWQPRR